ncbi:hypothetical protein PFUM301598_36930 [Pseudomonas fluorescens]
MAEPGAEIALTAYLESTVGLMWERACSRIGCVSQQMHRLTHRIREQTRSHNGLGAHFQKVLAI